MHEALESLRTHLPPEAPVGFYAHSTGALFALRFLEMNQQGCFGDPTLFDRIWLGSPLLRPEHGQHPIKQWGARWVGKIAPTSRTNDIAFHRLASGHLWTRSG